MRKATIVCILAAVIGVSLGIGLLKNWQLGTPASRASSQPDAHAPSLGTPSTAPEPAVAATPGPRPAPPPAVAPESNSVASTQAATTVYVVQSQDTLWDLAARHLGDPLRWQELYNLNRGRLQPDGRRLVDPHWIHPGWKLEFPAGATGIVTSTVATHVAPAAPTAPSMAQAASSLPLQQASSNGASATSGGLA